ncbi:hypothetical protein QLQ12_17115 [Actinoplanes sp. NEAU-A12]|uniref:Cell wall-active antibiotics response LiaF-like C-terminal domain-containing protein n=1 Tax=Actinoplanes sandaracinus TaxID=3045177 RepID=A0ABT6WKS9_9ACTN|nr:hypothetical protein [Actinoplanes sandaracinus]MDI6100329.1 hypothetical protein [Actinoplanes sandaracinus]
MADRKIVGDEPRPALRIAGYVQGHAEPMACPEPSPGDPGTAPGPLPTGLPNIADYWPDTPGQRGAGVPPALPPDVTGFGAPDRPARNRRPAMLAGTLAGLVAVGTLLLARPLIRTSQEPVAAPATTTVPASVAPTVVPSAAPTASPSAAPPAAAPPAAPSPPPAATTPPPAITSARFELVTGVAHLSVRAADLNGDAFRVTTPKDSGLDVDSSFTDGTLRVSTRRNGSSSGSGRIDVLLSDDIVWRLRMASGVRVASFDMAGGTVSDIDLLGGAHFVGIDLGRVDRKLPILMAGGIRTWRITTANQVPVTIAMATGAGAVTVYGDDEGGVRGGDTLRFGDRNSAVGLDIDAEAGVGSLRITRD